MVYMKPLTGPFKVLYATFSSKSYRHHNLMLAVKYVEEAIKKFQENVSLSVWHLKLNWGWVMQQDSDPKHRSKSASTKENTPSGTAASESWPQPEWDALAWPQESDSLFQTSQEYCRTERCKIPPDRCAGVFHNYRTHLLEVIDGVKLKLNSRVHIPFPPCTFNINSVSNKDFKM